MTTDTSALQLHIKLSKISLRKALSVAAESNQPTSMLADLMTAISLSENMFESLVEKDKPAEEKVTYFVNQYQPNF